MGKKKMLLHVLFSFLYCVYSGIGIFIYDDQFNISILYFTLILALLRIVQFYFCYLYVFPKYFDPKKLGPLFFHVFIALVLFIILRYGIEQVAFPGFFGYQNYNANTTAFAYILSNTYYSFPGIFFAAAIYGAEKSFGKEKENLKLKQEVAKAELAFLKAQINPHFLYNSLNYLYSLALPIADQMATAVLKLAELMRYTILTDEDEMRYLRDELDYIENYISFFRLRLDPQCYVNFNITGKIGEQRIPSLVLIAFVENAFKHGVLNDQKNPICINITIAKDALLFSTFNQIVHGKKDSSNGIGLNNIKRRLALICPNQHELTIVQKENTFEAKLYLQLT